MLRTFKHSLLFFSVLLLFSCKDINHFTIEGNGTITTQKRAINESFNSIETSNGIEVIVEQAKNSSVKVETDENLQDHIETKVENGVLVISHKNGSYTSSHKQKVYVTNPTFEELSANSAATIRTKGNIKGNNLSLNTSSAAKIEAELSIDNIKANSSSASMIIIKGMALNLDTESSSGSTINAEELLANNIVAETSSGSKTIVHPKVNLEADASSGSKIEYKNKPKHIDINTSSGGSIQGN